MMKNCLLALFALLIFAGCSAKQDAFAQVNQISKNTKCCLLYTSDAADDPPIV